MENEFEIDLDIRFQKGSRRLKMKKKRILSILQIRTIYPLFLMAHSV